MPDHGRHAAGDAHCFLTAKQLCRKLRTACSSSGHASWPAGEAGEQVQALSLALVCACLLDGEANSHLL